MKNLFFYFFLFNSWSLLSQEIVKEFTITKSDTIYESTGFTSYYTDDTRRCTFATIKNKCFKSNNEMPSNLQAINWYKLQLNPKVKTLYFVFSSNAADYSEVYIPTKNGYKRYETGFFSKEKHINSSIVETTLLSLSTANINFKKPIYYNKKSRFKAGKKSLKLPAIFAFTNDSNFWQHNLSQLTDITIALVSWLIFFAAILFFVNYIVLKDSNFLNYSLYLFFTALIFFPIFNLLYNFLNQYNPNFSQYLQSFSILMTSILYFYFVISFIKVKEIDSKIHTISKYTLGFGILYLIFNTIQEVFFKFFKYRFLLNDLYNIVFLLVSIYVFSVLIRKKLSVLKKLVLLGSFLLITGQILSLTLHNSLYFFLAVLIEIVVFSIVVSLQNKQTVLKEFQVKLALENEKKQREDLFKLDKTKTAFITNISHEFRTPLTLIAAPIHQELSNKDISQNTRKNLELVSRNTKRLIKLSDQLLDISKLESGNMQLHISNNNLVQFFNNLIQDFELLAAQKQLKYTSDVKIEAEYAWYDNDILEKINTNLLSNAIKYTPENGSVNITVTSTTKNLFVKIKNTGIGLNTEEQEKIFDRFYQVNSHKQGTGIGLALVKELTALHKGQISVTSERNKHTVFSFAIPIAASNYANTVSTIISSKEEKEITNTAISFETIEKPLLLIVEDNTEILEFIATIFSDSFQIITATDGKIGITKAIAHIPSIIISDIMMPITDGIELCKILNNNILTSHIPILLLTAKTGKENELLGVKTGAVDYITKPFDPELLQLKIKNIYKHILALQKKFEINSLLKTKATATSSLEQEFITKLQKVLAKKLVEPSFSVSDFGMDLGMSRMQLHRKLKAITGLSASEFIRIQRLKLAADLLKKSDMNIANIGYAVGFNNPNYFSKSFKEVYGCTPSEFIKK